MYILIDMHAAIANYPYITQVSIWQPGDALDKVEARMIKDSLSSRIV